MAIIETVCRVPEIEALKAEKVHWVLHFFFFDFRICPPKFNFGI